MNRNQQQNTSNPAAAIQTRREKAMSLSRYVYKASLSRLWQANRQRILESAITHAYETLLQHYPQAQDWLFDAHFLHHRGAAVLRSYLQGYAPSPTALAHACAEQWGWQGEKCAKFIASITPIAACFLRLLEGELRDVGARVGYASRKVAYEC